MASPAQLASNLFLLVYNLHINKKVLAHFKKNDPKIYDLLKTADTESWLGSQENDYFHALCETIIGQQLSSKAARSIFKKFSNTVTITPDEILNTADTTLRNTGISWAKVKYVKDLALKTKNGELNLEKIETSTEDEIILELTKVKGIGKWTAEMFLMFVLKREDVFSFGDLGLR